MTKDFAELFACLTARNVKALIVGGYAVAFHAKPRFTKDIDIFVDPSAENVIRRQPGRDRASGEAQCYFPPRLLIPCASIWTLNTVPPPTI